MSLRNQLREITMRHLLYGMFGRRKPRYDPNAPLVIDWGALTPNPKPEPRKPDGVFIAYVTPATRSFEAMGGALHCDDLKEARAYAPKMRQRYRVGASAGYPTCIVRVHLKDNR